MQGIRTDVFDGRSLSPRLCGLTKVLGDWCRNLRAHGQPIQKPYLLRAPHQIISKCVLCKLLGAKGKDIDKKKKEKAKTGTLEANDERKQ
uniref:Uncharacterized protein n=1 Tax=Romanomermis culicivorax TaxID=13658 RepID=A0A915HTD9_ROMCU